MELNEKSIELWCEEFHRYQRRTEITKDAAEMIVRLYMNPGMDKDQVFRYRITEQTQLCAMINYRSKCYDYKLTTRALILLSELSNVPGTIVMYLTYLQWRCYIDKVNEVTLEYLTTKIFPFGIPSKSDLDKAWSNQKCERGNLLDHYEYMKSIRF